MKNFPRGAGGGAIILDAPPSWRQEGLLGVGLYFRKATEGYLSSLMWLSKKGVFFVLIIHLVRPTLGYEFPCSLNPIPTVKRRKSSEAWLSGLIS